MRLAEIGQQERMVGGTRRLGIRERLVHEGYALGEAAQQRIRVPEVRGRNVKENPDLGRPAQLEGALEWRNSLGDGAPAEGDEAEGPVGPDEAVGLIDVAGNPDGVVAVRHRLRELAQLSEIPGEQR